MAMSQRRVEFAHDGHRFEVEEIEADVQPAVAAAGAAERRVRWVVHMDGRQVLEFEGGYPYRDEDLRKRILEWYGIQKPEPERP